VLWVIHVYQNDKDSEMAIKKICTAVLLIVSTFCGAATVDNKTQLAMQMLDAMQMDTMIKKMVDQVSSAVDKRFLSQESCDVAKPIELEFKQKLLYQLSKNLESDEVKVDMGAIYAQVYSEDELLELTAFYKSPLGKKMLAHTPELFQQAMQLGQERVLGLKPQIEKLTQEYSPRILEAAKTCQASAAAPSSFKK
jgi:hypothetical protein